MVGRWLAVRPGACVWSKSALGLRSALSYLKVSVPSGNGRRLCDTRCRSVASVGLGLAARAWANASSSDPKTSFAARLLATFVAPAGAISGPISMITMRVTRSG